MPIRSAGAAKVLVSEGCSNFPVLPVGSRMKSLATYSEPVPEPLVFDLDASPVFASAFDVVGCVEQ
jgi:hypothetical protein